MLTIKRARVSGLCFGVRDALEKAESLARRGPATVLGHLVHNPVVQARLESLGVRQVENPSAPDLQENRDYIITAHGISDTQRREWEGLGLRLHDTTCPLVHRAHAQLRNLVRQGFYPVVIGQPGHVEVRGLVGDYPQSSVIQEPDEIAGIPSDRPLGIVSQTTQPLHRVLELVRKIRESCPAQTVEFIDTVCQPTKQRQEALIDLCREVELVIVVGGRHSNNTRQLLLAARGLGCQAIQVESPEELQREWFEEVSCVGLTAGTSTLDDTIDAVEARLAAWADDRCRTPNSEFQSQQARINHQPSKDSSHE